MPYVYVMETSAAVKVGYSRDPQTRLCNVRTSCPLPISLFFTVSLKGKSRARAVESKSHDILKSSGFHVHSEWFSCSPSEAVSAIRAAIDLVDNIEDARQEKSDITSRAIAAAAADELKLIAGAIKYLHPDDVWSAVKRSGLAYRTQYMNKKTILKSISVANNPTHKLSEYDALLLRYTGAQLLDVISDYLEVK